MMSEQLTNTQDPVTSMSQLAKIVRKYAGFQQGDHFKFRGSHSGSLEFEVRAKRAAREISQLGMSVTLTRSFNGVLMFVGK